MSIRGPKAYRTSLEAHIAVHEQEIEDLGAELKALGKSAGKPPKGKRPSPDDGPPKKAPPAKVLKPRRERLERRLAAHAKLIELARQPVIPKVLAELAADPELAREAAADPEAFAKKRDLALPVGAKVEIEVGDGTIHISVVSYDEDAPFQLVWTPEGFHPPPEV